MAPKLRAALAAAGLAFTLGGSVSAQEAIDEITVLPFPPATPYRVWVSDLALNHLVDGKVHIVDGKTGTYQGVVPMGFTGATTLSPDGSRFYVATTYYDRGARGNKVDVLESYDTGTLEFLGEILLPPKRAMALTYEPLAAVTRDGRFALIQNATPASSITVVDLAGKKVASEIDTAGCWAIHPSPTTAARFTTICGDGTFETIELSDAGTQASRAKSGKLFDAQNDPIFVTGANVGDTFYFVTFDGDLVAVDLSGAEAKLVDRWTFVDGVDGGWRPGGYNILAAHRASGRVFVGMHPNGAEGSHKTPAQEIWALDPKAKKVLARAPGHNALALTINQEGAPLLFLSKEGIGLVALDPDQGLAVVSEMEDVAETALFIEAR